MAYKYEKVNQILLVPQIEDQLIMYIQQEQIEPGTKLPSEYKLAEKFGVGRSTIREAAKSLVSKGILEVKRGAGTFLKSTEMVVNDPLGLSQFEDKYRLAMELFDVRILLEPEVAAVACKNATEEDKERIKNLCDEVERLYMGGKNHIKKDMEFHEAIAKCSGNQVVEVLIPVILTAVTTFANLTNRELQKETIETHREITDAIMRGDSMGAKCAMIMHLTYNRQKLLEMSKNK
ncbi:DNA-binding transcriptional regulator, FadR family [Oribacterium sp. KHPX15]|uniref:FadR/GntR family transcriptional regulator n=1 Tax=Oribacterium sp. KHPX15 TaxID=1855342 RepID=UPI000898F530|nr:FadR/GntR family transcriptional regulator [Oribacterium sp. KHPX15]SEA01699.1 DNA-binding transcriptional regulator, FadR family [Oribacterium sp. KHPX15]